MKYLSSPAWYLAQDSFMTFVSSSVKGSNGEHWRFLRSYAENAAENKIDLLVSGEALSLY